jgi:hypothetical protein
LLAKGFGGAESTIRLKINSRLSYAILEEKLTSKPIAETLACKAGTPPVHPKQVKRRGRFPSFSNYPSLRGV